MHIRVGWVRATWIQQRYFLFLVPESIWPLVWIFSHVATDMFFAHTIGWSFCTRRRPTTLDLFLYQLCYHSHLWRHSQIGRPRAYTRTSLGMVFSLSFLFHIFAAHALVQAGGSCDCQSSRGTPLFPRLWAPKRSNSKKPIHYNNNSEDNSRRIDATRWYLHLKQICQVIRKNSSK